MSAHVSTPPPPTVALTGATGLIGSHLAERLVADGHAVTALARARDRAAALTAAGVRIVEGDLADRAALADLVRDASTVYHLAAATSHGSPDLRTIRATNVDGTANLVRAATDAGVERFVHVSSTGVLGRLRTLPGDEATPPRPRTAYERTKLAGEAAVTEGAEATGTTAVISRVGSTYGPRAHRGLRLFRDVRDGNVRLFGRGDRAAAWTHVDDVVDGLLCCADAPGPSGAIYNIGTDEIMTVAGVLRALASALGVPFRPRRRPAPPAFVVRGLERLWRAGVQTRYDGSIKFFLCDRRYSVEKAKRELGYEPRVSLRDGLARTVAALRSEGLL